MSVKYSNLVKEGKELYKTISSGKWKICELAEKACTIKLGGHAGKEYYTVAKFANDIGMSRKTLSEWLCEYRTIYKQLPKKEKSTAKNRDIREASRLLRGRKPTKDKAREAYKQITSRTTEDIAIIDMSRRIRGFVGTIGSEYVLKMLNQDDLKDIKESADMIVALLQTKECAGIISKKIDNHFKIQGDKQCQK